jgi:hypothetical protein
MTAAAPGTPDTLLFVELRIRVTTTPFDCSGRSRSLGRGGSSPSRVKREAASVVHDAHPIELLD